MGVVYRALDPVIGRTVAVKTVQLTAEAAGMSHDELLTRFQTEARAAGLLAHPNIVVVYDAGEDDGLLLHHHGIGGRPQPAGADESAPDRFRCRA